MKRTEKVERWEVPRQLEQKMIEIARQFRKEPTPSEAILWQALRKKQLEGRKFRRQQPIGRFVVDFFCASERLIVEVDGGIHESQKYLDEQRQQLLESLGLRFVRVSREEVERNLAGVLSRIRGEFGHPHPPLVSS
ncbi:endonuclease domain-containing protein [Coleofasciculus chthonoplastes]|uniref:endonuclease domain-containing protein n=1 Tax=Coleofasciculus chthonoplastes TaxID=64178 RepID=UPI0032FD90FB